jgi:hypothetical protein
MEETAARLKQVESAGPFATVNIYRDGTYDSAEIQNDGTVHFVVHFPPNTNVCKVGLSVAFEGSPNYPAATRERCVRNEVRGPGGTVVIGS